MLLEPPVAFTPPVELEPDAPPVAGLPPVAAAPPVLPFPPTAHAIAPQIPFILHMPQLASQQC